MKCDFCGKKIGREQWELIIKSRRREILGYVFCRKACLLKTKRGDQIK